MNEHVRQPRLRTPARPALAERRRFTADELEAMDRAGIIGPDERVELIDGQIIAMAAKGARHEIMRTRLTSYWSRRVPDELMVAAEPAFRLELYNEPEPDIIVFPEALQVPDVRGDTVLLVVEIADSSLASDLRIKGPLYSRFGVREYWVIDPQRRETHMHREPGPDGYASVAIAGTADLLTPLLVPALAVRLSDLRLD